MVQWCEYNPLLDTTDLQMADFHHQQWYQILGSPRLLGSLRSHRLLGYLSYKC